MFKHTHTAFQDENGVFTLGRDTIICICPKTAIVVPVQQQSTIMGGQPQMVMQERRNPCNTTCPFARIINNLDAVRDHPVLRDAANDQYVYEITCEGRHKYILLDSIKFQETKEDNGKSELRIAH